jgi:mercuric ion transport protein
MATHDIAGNAPDERTAPPPTGWLAGLGTVIGLAALAGSSCCEIPLALASLGVSSAVFSLLGELVTIRPFLLMGASLALAGGWTFYVLRRRKPVCAADGSCALPVSSRRTGILLSVGTAFVFLALVWEPYFEPVILRLFR